MTNAYTSVKRLALTGLLCVPLLQACSPMTIKNEQTGAWVPVQAGSLELHRDIRIPGGHTRTFFQDGAQLPHFNEFKPFCQLEITTLKETERTVQADTFSITRTGRKTEQVVTANTVLVASLEDVVWANDIGGSPRITHILYFRLQSERQPDVRELACGGAFDSPGNAVAPTLQDIAAALGKNATLLLR